jgi:hypothetical protein
MKLTELLQRKSECIRLAQSGFTFEEASDVNQLIIEQLQARIAELKKLAMVWHRFDIDDYNTYPECGMYLTLSIPERTEYREVDDESVYDVLWFELYSEEYWDKHNVTYYAILPEPQDVKE